MSDACQAIADCSPVQKYRSDVIRATGRRSAQQVHRHDLNRNLILGLISGDTVWKYFFCNDSEFAMFCFRVIQLYDVKRLRAIGAELKLK
ncbi:MULTISPECIES: hypothetical protein [Burkholderia]|uniref:hypothetical protein n=1 Tax=Burkholderia TaxID=32008 RepID=UPI001160A30B|nr:MULTISPECIES: hypothetical protein [Burkholderia]